MILEIFTVFILLLACNLLENARRRRKLPPGPIRWPIIGNIFEMFKANSEYPHLALDKMSKKYGEVFSFAYGVNDAVVISSNDAMKQILRQDEMLGRYSFPYDVDRSMGKNESGLIWQKIPIWRDLRSFLMKCLKDHGYNKPIVMEKLFRKEIEYMTSHIKTLADKNDGILKVDGTAFAVCSSNTFLTLIGTNRFAYDDPEYLKILAISILEINLLSLRNICNAFPFLRTWFPKRFRQQDSFRAYKIVFDFISDIIHKAKSAKQSREDASAQNVVETIVDQIEKNRGNPQTSFTENQLTLALLDLFSGSEIMGPMLKWTFLFLVLNPKVMDKIRDEVSLVENDLGKKVSPLDYDMLPYTQAVMFESLRMTNVSPIPPPRTAVKDYYYKDFKIPKGTLVIWNLHSILRNPDIWGDPDVFRPERFLDSEGRLANTEVAAGTFGFGKRVCVGSGYAWDMMFLVITELLRTFTFETIPGKIPSTENPHSAITVAPRTFFVRISQRKE